MIAGKDVVNLIEQLESKAVYLWHACQFQDLQSYIKLKGVPSRNLLVKQGLAVTPFDTDDNDKKNGMWDKVFFNFSDFGATFANLGKGLPSPYGPIVLRFHPQVLSGALDVSITSRSAGASDFSRLKESMSWEAVGESLFEETKRGWRVKGWPEMNISYKGELASFSMLSWVLVDPYHFQSGSLFDCVKQELSIFNSMFPKIRIFPRFGQSQHQLLLQTCIDKNISKIPELKKHLVDTPLTEWANSLGNLDFILDRYVRYTTAGTVSVLGGLARSSGASSA